MQPCARTRRRIAEVAAAAVVRPWSYPRADDEFIPDPVVDEPSNRRYWPSAFGVQTGAAVPPAPAVTAAAAITEAESAPASAAPSDERQERAIMPPSTAVNVGFVRAPQS
jgi:hypothetical protein